MMDASQFQPGDRVRLIKMDDPYREAPIGITGTVESVVPAPINVVNISWDNGFSLNPCLDEDIIEKL